MASGFGLAVLGVIGLVVISSNRANQDNVGGLSKPADEIFMVVAAVVLLAGWLTRLVGVADDARQPPPLPD